MATGDMSETARRGNQEAVTIDEALEKLKFGRFNYLLICFSGVVLINVVLESVGVSFILPILECDFSLNYQQQGVLGAVCFLGIIVSSHMWGYFADTIGRKRIMKPTLLLGFLLTILSSFAPNFELLVLLRFVSGIILSGSSATVFAYLGEFHGPKHRNRAVLSAAFISAFSAIFFPILAWFFINQNWSWDVPYIGIAYKPWRLYMVVCGFAGFVCGLVMHFQLPESPKYCLAIGDTEQCLMILRNIYARNQSKSLGATNSEYPVKTILPDLSSDLAMKRASLQISDKIKSEKRNALVVLFTSMWSQTEPLFTRQYIRKTILGSFIQFIIFFSAHGVYMWFPYILNSTMQYTQQNGNDQQIRICDIIYFTQAKRFNQLESSNLNSSMTLDHLVDVSTQTPITAKKCVTQLELSTFKHTFILEVIYVLLLLCVSYAIGKFGRKPILFIILFICGSCGILALIVTTPLAAIYLFVVLLCCGLGTTVVNAIVIDMYPTNLRAMAVCISLMLGRIGSVVGSNVLGILLESHCELVLFASSGSLILAAFLGCLLPQTNQRTAKEKQLDQKMPKDDASPDAI